MPSNDFTWGSVTWDGDVSVSHAPASKTADMKDDANFRLIRVVANLKLTKKTAGAIYPPAKVRVNITPSDLQTAGHIDNIKVAYWKSGWVVLTAAARDASSVTVHYDKNGDPPIAVGY